PGDRLAEAIVETEARCPTQHPPRLTGVQALYRELMTSLVSHLRDKPRSHELEEPLDQLEHCDRRLVGKVEGLTPKLWIGVEPFGEQQVGLGSVLNIEVVAYRLAV